MSMLRLAIYLLVTTLMILNAQWTRISANKDIQGGQVAVAMREVLYGLSLYSLTHWTNLTAATPAAITYTNPDTKKLTEVVDIFFPTADELMMLGFLASPTAKSTTYPGLPWGGAGRYATAIAILPKGCSGNACTTDLDVYWTQPVALSKGTFDVLLTSTVVNDSNIAMGYTYPDNTALFKSSNATWSHGVPAPLNAQAGLAMLHTSAPKSFLAARSPNTGHVWWQAPKTIFDQLSQSLIDTNVSDISLVSSTGVAYFWTGSEWKPLNINESTSTYLGAQSGNTGSTSLYLGNLSGTGFYHEK